MNINRIVIAIFVVSTITTAAFAQRTGSAFSGTTTSTGMFGSRSLGQGIGASGSNFSGSPGNMVQEAQAGAGQVEGGERYLRDSRQPGQFVGADSADTSAFYSQMQGNQGGSGLQELLRGAAQREFQNQDGGGGSRNPLRPRLTLGFRPEINYAQVSTQMTTRLAKLPNLAILDPVTVSIAGRTAILRGRVATEHDRQMVAQIALLEPGVSAVQNDLRIGQPVPPRRPTPKSAPADLPAPPAAPTAPQFDP
jgi:osmotically-inducible protein OsmY